MQIANTSNFVSIISEEKPAMIFFHTSENESENKKIKTAISLVEKELPLLNVYEYHIDENDDNEFLADMLDFKKVPVLVFFKDGSLHRYKNKLFTKASITHFVGGGKTYKSEAT